MKAVTGTLLNVTEVVIGNGGVLESDFLKAGSTTESVYGADKTTVNEGGNFVTSLNILADGTAATTQKPADAVKLSGDFELAGGQIINSANQEAVRNFVVSGTNLTAKADYEFGSILAKDANSVFNVATGNVTVADLNTVKTTISEGGSLQATKLTATSADAVAVENGTLTASLANLNLKVDSTTKTLVADAYNANGNQNNVGTGAITLGTNGVLVISDYQGEGTAATLTKTSIETLLVNTTTGKVGTNNGLIDIGNVDITDNGYNTTTKRYVYKDMVHGVTTNALKQASVDVTDSTTSNTISHSESFGNVYTGTAGLTIDQGATVTL